MFFDFFFGGLIIMPMIIWWHDFIFNCTWRFYYSAWSWDISLVLWNFTNIWSISLFGISLRVLSHIPITLMLGIKIISWILFLLPLKLLEFKSFKITDPKQRWSWHIHVASIHRTLFFFFLFLPSSWNLPHLLFLIFYANIKMRHWPSNYVARLTVRVFLL